uniref:hypothetical protein n=1 Tax=Actinomyces timonensis TaxID=1288391 RepID=UPI003F55AD2A
MSAWILATRIRAATVLGVGRDSGERVDVLPSDERGIRLVGRLLGLAVGRERDLEDLYRRSARHARAVVERVLRSAGGGPGLPDQPERQGQRSRRGSAGTRRTAPSPAGAALPGQAGGAGQAVAPERASSSRSTSPQRRVHRRNAGPYPWS